MKGFPIRHRLHLRQAWLFVTIALVITVTLLVWFFSHRTHCANYRDTIRWLAEYVLPIEKVVLPSDAEICLSNYEKSKMSPIFLQHEDSVDLLMALETIRPDVILAGKGMIWDNVLRHAWFQKHYLPTPQTSAESGMLANGVFTYHPALQDMGVLHQLAVSDSEMMHPSLWGYELGSDYLATGEPFSLRLFWQSGSDALALDVPEPGYQLRIQLVMQDSSAVWWQTSQPLSLEILPVAGNLRLASPVITLPDNLPTPTSDVDIIVHLLHPDRRELPLYTGDSLVTLPYLPDSQFTSFPEEGETQWQFGEANAPESIAMVGYDLPDYAFAGERVKLVLVWQALATLSQDYKVFVHIIKSENGAELMITQDDSQPAAWRAPTSGWTEAIQVRDVHSLTMPADVSRGEYDVFVGLYDAQTGDRLQIFVPDGETPLADRIRLGSLWVR